MNVVHSALSRQSRGWTWQHSVLDADNNNTLEILCGVLFNLCDYSTPFFRDAAFIRVIIRDVQVTFGTRPDQLIISFLRSV